MQMCFVFGEPFFQTMFHSKGNNSVVMRRKIMSWCFSLLQLKGELLLVIIMLFSFFVIIKGRAQTLRFQETRIWTLQYLIFF